MQGKARRYKARQGDTGRYNAIQRDTTRYNARQVNLKRCKAMQGDARRCKAMCCSDRFPMGINPTGPHSQSVTSHTGLNNKAMNGDARRYNLTKRLNLTTAKNSDFSTIALKPQKSSSPSFHHAMPPATLFLPAGGVCFAIPERKRRFASSSLKAASDAMGGGASPV
jgi:hypothetical protein